MPVEHIRHTLTASPAALDYLMHDEGFRHPMVVRLSRGNAGYDVGYGMARSGDFITTFGGFSFAVRSEEKQGVRDGVLDYDPHHGLTFRPAR